VCDEQIVGQIIPKGIVVIPGTDGMQLLLFHDSMYMHVTFIIHRFFIFLFQSQNFIFSQILLSVNIWCC